jgi:serine/threonine-protein kinase
MNFLTGYQADRLISQIREEADPTSPGAKKAFEKLGKLGPAAVPKILDALGAADPRQSAEYVDLLAKLTTDKTLLPIARGLMDSDPRTVKGTAAALAATNKYNVNRLVDLLGEDLYSKAAIVEVLTVHKDRLNIRQLLNQIYVLQPGEKAAVFKLIDEIATEDLLPDLLSRMDGKDPVAKMHILNVIGRFDKPEVQKVFQEQLKDSSKLVRKAALAGVAKLKGKVDIGLVSPLLLDPDVDVINKAIDVIVQFNDPATVKYLVPAMKADNEFARRAAVEILNVIGTTSSIKHLLEAIADEDWWVRSRAADALARIGGERVVSAVLELVRDKDENIRRAAIEILNTCGDKRAVDHLILATKDKDWWVSERAADALAGIGDNRALPAILEMVERGGRSLPVALGALGKLGDSKLIDRVVPYLQQPEKEVRIAAIETLTMLADEINIERVRGLIQQALTTNEETIVRAGMKAIQKLDGRLAGSGQFSTMAASVSASATPPSQRGPIHAAPPPASAPPQTQLAAPTTPVATTTAARTLLIEGTDLSAVTSSSPTGRAFDLNALKAGDMIEGRYKFIQKIGKGAFGTVVLVEDTVVEERLILKFLNANVASDEEMMKRFVHELRYSRKITHRNVIRIYDFLYISGGYAISMEYFPSHTLATEIANEKPMNPKKAVRYALDICIGMHVAHQQGIIHRDLKPANILIDDTGLLKIVDFGVAAAAKSGDTQLTKTGYVIGSPKYMAPEQILGKKVDERADIYSLGVILYEMLAGTPPYSRGDHMAVMYQHVQGKAAPLNEANTNIATELALVVHKAMQVDKAKRYETMDQFAKALAAVSGSVQ